MSKRKKKSASLAGFTVVAISLAISAFADWDGQSWVYTPETHTTIDPATAGGQIVGLDAKARGLGGTAGDTEVDKWYWDMEYSNACDVDFDPPGGMIIIR